MTRPVRICSFDGGGVHAASYLPVVSRLESLLGGTLAESGSVAIVAGTSTGAIVAAACKLNVPARDIEEQYRLLANRIFPSFWYRLLTFWRFPFNRYSSTRLRDELSQFFRAKLQVDYDITWHDLATRSPFPDLELIVTLWDVKNQRSTFLSTNLSRSRQNQILQYATLADIITACCSAPTYFPPRNFRFDGSDYVFCDGGITGMNNPAALSLSLVQSEEQGCAITEVISFGAGETRRMPGKRMVGSANDRGSRLSASEIGNRHIIENATTTIDALFNATSDLMNGFYANFGQKLNVAKYLRTNQMRSPSAKLDSACAVPELLNQHSRGVLYFEFHSAEEYNAGTVSASSRFGQPTSNELDEWNTLLSSVFQVERSCSEEMTKEKSIQEAPLLPVPKDVFPTATIHSHELRPSFLRYTLAPTVLVVLLSLTSLSSWLFYRTAESAKSARRESYNDKAAAIEQAAIMRHLDESAILGQRLKIRRDEVDSRVMFEKARNYFSRGGNRDGVLRNETRIGLLNAPEAIIRTVDDSIYQMSFTVDGEWLCVALANGSVIAWNTSAPSMPPFTSLGDGTMRAFATSPDSPIIAIWQPESGGKAQTNARSKPVIEIASLDGKHSAREISVALAPAHVSVCSSYCMYQCRNQTVNVIELESGVSVLELADVSGAVVDALGRRLFAYTHYLGISRSPLDRSTSCQAYLLAEYQLNDSGSSKVLVDSVELCDRNVARLNADKQELGKDWKKEAITANVGLAFNGRFLVCGNSFVFDLLSSDVRSIQGNSPQYNRTSSNLFTLRDGRLVRVSLLTGQVDQILEVEKSISELMTNAPILGGRRLNSSHALDVGESFDFQVFSQFNDVQYNVGFMPVAGDEWCLTQSPNVDNSKVSHVRLWDVKSGALYRQFPIVGPGLKDARSVFVDMNENMRLLATATGRLISLYTLTADTKMKKPETVGNSETAESHTFNVSSDN